MKKHNKRNLILMVCMALALFATACEDTKKIEEANKFVDSANKKADEAKALLSKAVNSLEVVTKDMTDLEDVKKDHGAEVKEIIKNYDKVAELQKSAAGDFRSAATANSNEKFKAYYEASAKDMETSSEMVKQNKELAQAMLDSPDIDAYEAKMTATQTKIDALTKESNDQREKLKKLEAEVKELNK